MKKITLLFVFIICTYSLQLNAQATCASPVAVTVETDCSTATPYTIDYSTAADLGTSDLSCDTFGTNTGAWLEFTAPASGAVTATFTDTNEYALFDSCGGTEIVCENTATGNAVFTGLTPGATYKLAVWKDSASSGTSDVCLEVLTCPAPTGLTATPSSTTEVDFTWTAGGSETDWTYEFGLDGFTQGAGIGGMVAVMTTPSASETMLIPGETYEVRVQSNCGGADGDSDWVSVTWTQPSPAPPNDDCGGAIPLTVNGDFSCTTVTAGTTVGATASTNADDVTGTPNTDVWYSFVATGASHRIVLSNVLNQGGGTSTSIDMGMGVYDGSGGCAGLAFVDDSDPNTLNLSGLTAATTYYVRVYGWFSTIQYNNFDICVGTPAPPPANDDCANAFGINSLPYNNTQDAVSATNNGGFHNPTGCGSMNDGVWYAFTTVDAGTVDIAISGVTGWDPEVAIYSGSCGTFTCVDNADSGGTGSGETLTGVAVAANTTYWINIGYFSGTTDNSEGPFTIDVSTSDTTTTLSVEDNRIEGFSLFPTVVKEELNFRSLNDVEQITVFNLLGQKVFSSTPNITESSVNLSSLKGGLYIVKVKVGDATATYKIIKE